MNRQLFDCRGYTLVEILVVVAIVGILATIAVPQFSSYREKSYCATIKSDLGILARHQENYYLQNEIYLVATSNPDGSSNMLNHRWSPGVTVDSATADINGWSVTASHSNCSSGPYTYNSTLGGIQ